MSRDARSVKVKDTKKGDLATAFCSELAVILEDLHCIEDDGRNIITEPCHLIAMETMPRQALEVRGETFKVLDFIRANETLLGFRQGFFEFKVLVPHERVEIIAFTGLLAKYSAASLHSFATSSRLIISSVIVVSFLCRVRVDKVGSAVALPLSAVTASSGRL